MSTDHQKFFVFDVESIGLHGEGFSVGWSVIGSEGSEYEASFLAVDPFTAKGTAESRRWVAKNIPALRPTHKTLAGMRSSFWAVLQLWKNSGAIIVADCAWPVEARFLAQCVDDDPTVREWQGPYPLHDAASIILSAGGDPLATNARENDELPAHHPMHDARQSARMIARAMAKSARLPADQGNEGGKK